MNIKCFYLEPTSMSRKTLRRYCEAENVCPGKYVYHNANKAVDFGSAEDFPHSEYPTKCDSCDYLFQDADPTQFNIDRLYMRSDTKDLITIAEATPGAIWDCDWYPKEWMREDGHHYICRTPEGDWSIDGGCSNCTRKGEKHHCWCRHGTPPNLTVDKSGDTCQAGAGSILIGKYHAFLRNGELIEC